MNLVPLERLKQNKAVADRVIAIRSLAYCLFYRLRASRQFTIDGYLRLANRLFGLNQKTAEITAFLQFMSGQDATRICEIGIDNGGNNFLLSQFLPRVEKIIGIDLFIKHPKKLRFCLRRSQSSCFLQASSHAADTLEKVATFLNGEQLDLLFIDGDHTYEGVKRDFLLYRDLVKDGGFIAFHDVVPDSRLKTGIRASEWAGDVPILWQEIKPLYSSREFIEDPGQNGYGIGVISYSSSVSLPVDF